jgi:hypothetical protein
MLWYASPGANPTRVSVPVVSSARRRDKLAVANAEGRFRLAAQRTTEFLDHRIHQTHQHLHVLATQPETGGVHPQVTPALRAITSLYKILRFLAWDGILCDMGKHTHIELTSEERTELEKLIRTGNAPARTHTRARILLLSDRSQGQKRTDQEVADAVLCCKNTVRNVRRRFLSGGLQAALSDKGWPGASPKFTGEVEAKLVMLACSEPPEGAARWTLRLLADKMVELHYVDSMSHVTVGEILKKTKSSRGE